MNKNELISKISALFEAYGGRTWGSRVGGTTGYRGKPGTRVGGEYGASPKQYADPNEEKTGKFYNMLFLKKVNKFIDQLRPYTMNKTMSPDLTKRFERELKDIRIEDKRAYNMVINDSRIKSLMDRLGTRVWK